MKKLTLFLIFTCFIFLLLGNSFKILADISLLLNDSFRGSVIDTTKWTLYDSSGSNVSQNNGLTIKGNNSWGTNGISTTQTFSRGNTLTLESIVKVNFSDKYALGLGYGDKNFFTGTNSSAVFINFDTSGVFKLFEYENAIKREALLTSVTYVPNRYYKLQIIIQNNQGAKFKIYEDLNGDEDFNDINEDIDLLANSQVNSVSLGNFTNKAAFFQTYSSLAELNIASFKAYNEITPQINLSEPLKYQVFQRNITSGNGNIEIKGTYTGNPIGIEARFNGGAWELIDGNPRFGNFEGILSNQNAGQGNLEIRFASDHNILNQVEYIGIGDVFLVAGQSNASGRGENNQIYLHPNLKAALFGNDYIWKNLIDPSDSSVAQRDSVSIDTNAHGSLWPILASKLMEDQNVPIAFIPTAKGATSIVNWQRNDLNPRDITTLYGSAINRAKATNNIRAVLWWQGESDVSMPDLPSSYKNALKELATNFSADLNGQKLVAFQIGFVRTQDQNTLVNLAIRQAGAELPSKIVVGPSLSDIDLTRDVCTNLIHFCTDAHFQIVANRVFDVLKMSLYTDTENALLGDFTDECDTINDNINICDADFIVASFGNPYTIYDYNLVLTNYNQ